MEMVYCSVIYCGCYIFMVVFRIVGSCCIMGVFCWDCSVFYYGLLYHGGKNSLLLNENYCGIIISYLLLIIVFW